MVMRRLNPWRRNRAERLQKYLEIERHDWNAAMKNYRNVRDEQERQIDLALHHERREGGNWLENREMRVCEAVLKYERRLIAVHIDIRKRLGLECPELLSDEQLTALEESILRSVRSLRLARRNDYELRARAAGVPTLRPIERDAAAYGELEELARREIHKLQLDRSLGRIAEPSKTSAITTNTFWNDPVLSKVIAQPLGKGLTAVLVAGLAWVCAVAHHGWSSTRPSAEIELPEIVGLRTPISVKYANIPLSGRLWLATQGTSKVWTYGTCGDPPGSFFERTSSAQLPTRGRETGTWTPREEINIGSRSDAGKIFTYSLCS
jgi:hypothetical protein